MGCQAFCTMGSVQVKWDWQNGRHERDNGDKAVFVVGGDCNSGQTAWLHSIKPECNEKSNETFWLIWQDNVAGLHCLPQQNRCLFSHLKQYGCQDSRPTIGKETIDQSNSAWPDFPDRPRLAVLLVFVPKPHPTPQCSALPDLLPWRCRLCFFLSDEGKEFVQLNFLNCFWCGRIGELSDIGIDPIGDTLWTDLQVTGYSAKVHPIDIQFDGLQFECFWITDEFGLRGVSAFTCFALISLAPRWVLAIFDHAVLGVTSWTVHPPILTHFIWTLPRKIRINLGEIFDLYLSL